MSQSIHVLVEFVEEGSSTAVVPLQQRALDLKESDSVHAGETITVLWYDGRNILLFF